MKAELIPIAGGPPIPITRDVTVIGRRSYCDVVLDDPSLSKRHCLVVKTDGLLVIRDLATTNGTKVKGQKIRWAALLPDDRISFGRCKFRVYLGPDNLPSPSEKAGQGVQPTADPAAAAKPAGVPPAPTPARRPAKPIDDDIPQLNIDDPTWLSGLGGEADASNLMIDLD
ncbi:FHA domain-containing protein [Tundrisphaera sp. TA3]|uniref:FHA domain-containing protein n=1 Tax=Tundrisphaera sp. TA3 TaxID=3435775 RepID=UPI003EB7FA34